MQITAVGTEDVTRAMSQLANFDEIATKHWKYAMKQSVKPIAATAKVTAPIDTGRWAKSIGSRVTGKGTKVTGRIGSFMEEWYPNVVEHGAKAHAMSEDGQGVHVRVHGQWKTLFNHPGFKGRFVFKKAFEHWRFWVNSQFQVANEAISEELARK